MRNTSPNVLATSIALLILALSAAIPAYSQSLVTNNANNWTTGTGPAYSDIATASVDYVNGSFLFSMMLRSNIPINPNQVYLGYNWNLDTDSNPNTGRKLIGNFPVDIGWDYAVEIYWDNRPVTLRPPGQFYGVVINPAGTMTFISTWKINGNNISASVPSSLLASPTSFNWLVAADGASGYDGQFTGYYLDIAPTSGHATFSQTLSTQQSSQTLDITTTSTTLTFSKSTVVVVFYIANQPLQPERFAGVTTAEWIGLASLGTIILVIVAVATLIQTSRKRH